MILSFKRFGILLLEIEIFIFKKKYLVKRNLGSYTTILSLENYMTFDFFVTKQFFIFYFLFSK